MSALMRKELATTTLVECPYCNGRGTVETFHGPDDEMALEDCLVCEGAGRVSSERADLIAVEDEGDIDAQVAAWWERAA